MKKYLTIKWLMTVINLAKSLGMTVVQEGVETKETFDKICGMGCDIIQGYYYAKAIPLEEYKLFIKSNTSINTVSSRCCYPQRKLL